VPGHEAAVVGTADALVERGAVEAVHDEARFPRDQAAGRQVDGFGPVADEPVDVAAGEQDPGQQRGPQAQHPA
jgi:hypothetical protein